MSIPEGFIRVSRRTRCPVCDHADWCLITRDGARAICPRVESSKLWGEAGWLHVISETVAEARPIKREKPQANPTVDMSFVVRVATSNLTMENLRAEAESLGVSVASLQHLGIGWHRESHAFSFPMYDHDHNTIGIRLRKHEGPKFAVTGSMNGLFIPDIQPTDGWLFVVEGPTDTAAMLDTGLACIGRPSCSACVEMTTKCCKGRSTVVLSDSDEPKSHPTKGKWKPGQEGAVTLANALLAVCPAVKVIEPLGYKDARAWVRSGAGADDVMDLVRNTNDWSKK